jgi:tRNA modification GTPase
MMLNKEDQNIGERIIKLNDNDKIIKILNKIDLLNGNKIDIQADVYISALTGKGMEHLFIKLKEFVLGKSNYSEKSAIVSNLRHYNCLKKAKEYLQNTLISIKEQLSGEFIAVDLRNAENTLGEIIGEVTSDDILNNIF